MIWTRYGVSALLVAASISGADKQKEEQAIRARVAELDRVLTADAALVTDDIVYVTGQYEQPLEGKQAIAEARQRLRQEPSRARKNEKRTTTIKRLRIADSGELAYEYSEAKNEFDRPDGTHVAGTVSMLRVWRKAGDSWKVEAAFIRPNGAR